MPVTILWGPTSKTEEPQDRLNTNSQLSIGDEEGNKTLQEYEAKEKTHIYRVRFGREM